MITDVPRNDDLEISLYGSEGWTLRASGARLTNTTLESMSTDFYSKLSDAIKRQGEEDISLGLFDEINISQVSYKSLNDCRVCWRVAIRIDGGGNYAVSSNTYKKSPFFSEYSIPQALVDYTLTLTPDDITPSSSVNMNQYPS